MGKPQPQNPSVAKIPAHLVQAVARKMEVPVTVLKFRCEFFCMGRLLCCKEFLFAIIVLCTVETEFGGISSITERYLTHIHQSD